MWSFAGSMGLVFKIEGLKSPAFLKGRVETFVNTYRCRLATFAKNTFESKKGGLFEKLFERPKNLAEEASPFWYQIDSRYHDFEQCPSSIVRGLLAKRAILVSHLGLRRVSHK